MVYQTRTISLEGKKNCLNLVNERVSLTECSVNTSLCGAALLHVAEAESSWVSADDDLDHMMA